VILVVDASCLITLAKIGRLNLVREFADQVVIPDAVYNEVVGRGAGRPGHAEVAQASWISRRTVRDHRVVDRLEIELGRGESEAIVLARELNADLVIIDDTRARQIAEVEGVRVVGLLGLLLTAKERGVLEAVKPILNEMIKVGFYIGDVVYRNVIRQAREDELS
jgi:predicted nucleic acid-binding protein